MENTTSQPNNQDQSLSHDELAATLAHATNLQEQSMPQDETQQPEAPQEPQNAPTEELPKETTKEPSKEKDGKEGENIAEKIGKMETDIELIKQLLIKNVKET